MADEAMTSFEGLLSGIPNWITEIEVIIGACAKLKEQSAQSQNQQSKPNSAELPFASLKARCHKTSPDSDRSSEFRKRGQSRTFVAVPYDGDVQRRIEELVRGISSCRNHLRKGKLSAKIDSFARLGSSTGDGDVDISFAMRTRRSPGIARGDDIKVFDEVDATLGKSQGLCENAAHQVLREGDCTTELTGAKAHLVEAQQKASLALPGLQRKAQEAADRQRAEQADEDSEDVPNLDFTDSPQLNAYSSQQDIEVDSPHEPALDMSLSGFAVRTRRLRADLKQLY